MFGIKSLDKNQKIPLFFPDFHKTQMPIQISFYIEASQCYDKQIAIDPSLVLKCIKLNFRELL